MSSEKHPNLQLNKWTPSDYVKMAEFNENFKKIDDKAKAHDDSIGGVTAQLADLGTQKADKTEVNSLSTAKADKTYVDTLTSSIASGSPKGTYATLSALQTAFPTGNSNIYLVIGNVKEIDTLNITSTPTTAGNVTVTLNGVATNVAVTAGVKEVASLTVLAVPTTAENVTVTLNGVATTIALDPATDTTTDLVATKIRNTVFPNGCVTGGTGSIVTFTAGAVGVKTDATYSAGTTGATGTMSTTTQGVDADTTTSVATKIRGTSFSGWTTGGTGTTVTFTATVAGTKTAPSYFAGSTGSTGTMSVTTAGVNADGNWYYWSGSAWTAGGTYQTTGIGDGSVYKKHINGLTVPFDEINDSVKTFKGFTPIQANDIYSVDANFAFLDDGVTLVATATTGKAFSPGFFPEGIINFEFEVAFEQDDFSTFIILGGEPNLYTIIGLAVKPSENGYIYNMVNGVGTYLTKFNIPSVPHIGDIVRINVNNDVYTFSIKKVGTSKFETWFVLKKTDVPSATGWANNSRLGVVKETNGLITNPNLIKSPRIINDDSVIDKINYINKMPRKMLISDITSVDATFNYLADGTTLNATVNTAKAFAPGFFPTNIEKISFDFQLVESGKALFIILGGTIDNYTAIALGAGTTGDVYDLQSNGVNTLRRDKTPPYADPAIDDTIIVSVTGGSYDFKLIKAGTTTVTDWFTLKKSDVPSATGWLANSNLGIIKEKTSTANLMKNVKLYNGSINSTVDELNLEIRSLNNLAKANKSRWNNNILNTLGDSITQGTGTTKIYHQYLQEILGLSSVNNYGISGTCITATNDSDTNAMCIRYANMTNTADIITIFAGTNDYGTNKPLGVKGDTVKTTFYGALKVMIEGLINKYPKKTIVFFTPLQRDHQTVGEQHGVGANSAGFTLKQYVDVIIEMCGDYSIPVLDLYRNGGITVLNVLSFATDGIHIDATGHERIANKMAAFINAQ